MRATLYPSEAPSISLLCQFDYLNSKRDGFPDLGEIPSACHSGFSVLQIDTSTNNWFLSPDIHDLCNALGQYAPHYDTVYAICFSMGIVPALIISKILNIQKIMGFSPMASVFGHDIPDHRFRSFRDYIQCPEYCDLWKGGNLNIEGVLCFDPATHPIDRLQAQLVKTYYPNLKLLALPFGGHPCFQIIKDTMGFRAIQDLVLSDQFDPQSLRALHKISRKQSTKYQKRLALKEK